MLTSSKFFVNHCQNTNSQNAVQSKQASIDFESDGNKTSLYNHATAQSNQWNQQPDNHVVASSDSLLKQSRPDEIERPPEGVEMRYDSTGMFHWCTPRRIAEAELTKEGCTKLNLQVKSQWIV